ncbi:hypothetical protein P047_03227, partial [Brucella abortus 99-9971-159]
MCCMNFIKFDMLYFYGAGKYKMPG